jgi:hypothetical protein
MHTGQRARRDFRMAALGRCQSKIGAAGRLAQITQDEFI